MLRSPQNDIIKLLSLEMLRFPQNDRIKLLVYPRLKLLN